MKAADILMARLGGNMAESMGPAQKPAAAPSPAPLHGEAAKYKGAARVKDALSIKLENIAPDADQPRKDFDPGELEELASSLKSRGQLQPIRVRWEPGVSKWVIIAGERRYRAALAAGLTELVCIDAAKNQTEDERLEDQLVENCVRADLKPIEQARAFKTLMDRRGWSYRQLGAALSLSSGHITRAMALLDLPEDVQGRVESGELAPSVAYEVSRLVDADQQREVAAKVVDGGLNRAEAVEAVRKASAKPKGRGVTSKSPRKVTSRTFRATGGVKLTLECKRGVDDAAIHAAIAELTAALEADGQAAA